MQASTTVVDVVDRFLRGHIGILERVATGGPLPAILESIVRLIEGDDTEAACSVFMLDATGHIHPAAAPSLPPDYVAALDGLPIGPEEGSCGTAAYRKERVIIEDIATHPFWVRHRDVALAHGLRACWSTPVLAPDGAVLGTFAIYYRTVRGPTEDELQRVDTATHLAAIAIVRDRANRSLELQQRMADEVRAGEVLRASIYASVSESIFALAVENGRYRFTSVNAAFNRMTGAPDRIIGRYMDEVVPEVDRASVLGRYETAIAERRSVRWEQIYIVARQQVLHGEITITPIFEGDRCVTVIGAIHDVTEQRAEEARRRELEAQLHQNQRLQALGTLASRIAHDFNNVLAAVAANADLALHSKRPGAVEESLAEIQKASRRATALVRQILAFGRNQGPHREPADLRTVVEEALGLLRATLPASVELETAFLLGSSQTRIDTTQIHQVVMNLVTNAAHAIADRPGRITLATRLHDQRVGDPIDLAEGQYVCLSVEDTGHGIDDETLAHVFDPFFTTKPAGDGTGLGLSIVHGIMRSHDGAVTMQSTVGKGTTVSLYFPIVVEVPDTAVGQRILLVDDEEAMVFLGSRILTKLGYQVAGYTDPREALDVFRANPDRFDIVISDVSMPTMTGPALLRELIAIRSDLTMVLTSGHIQPEDVAAARALGIPEPIPKPHSVEEFAWIVTRQLRAMRARAG